MERWWFNSMVFKKELERRYGIKKSTDSLGPIENTSESEDPSRKGRAKNIPSSKGRDNSSYSNIDHLFGVKDILNFISGETFLVRDSNGDSYSIYFDIENHIFEIDSEDSLYNCYMYDTQSSWNNHITSCIDSYLQSQIGIDTSIGGDSSDTGGDSSESYISRCIFEKRRTSSESGRSNIRNRAKSSDLTLKERSNDLDERDLDERSNDLDERDLDERSNDLDERDLNERDLTERDLDERSNDLDERSNDLDERSNDPYDESNSLWVLCENPDCHTLNYKKFLKSQMHTCEKCGYHFKMNSSDRIESLIDPGTWDPMDEDMVSIDPIEWDSESNSEFDEDPDLHFEPELLAKLGAIFGFEEIAELNNTWEDTFFPVKSDSELNENDTWEDAFFPVKSDSELNENDTWSLVVKSDSELDSEEDTYKERLDSYQRKTGLNEAVQTGVGQLNGIRVAIGFMDFEFIGGSMGSVVGEKIARLIEYATNQFLPLIIVCASGGARMQEGSLSLMQMAKIASALYDYQSNKKLFYVSILTSPTTGGVTASFGMLGDIIIAEPDSYIAFAGQRVIEQTLNEIVPEGSQETEYLFEKGLFDLVVPRNLLKDVLSELLKLHFFFPLNYTPIK